MRCIALDRIDFLITKILILALTVSVAAATLGAPSVRWLRERSLTWELGGQGPTTVPAAVVPTDGTTLRGADTIAVSIDDPGARLWVMTLLPGLALTIAAVVVAWQLMRLLESIRTRQPFVTSNAVALRIIAITVLAGGTVVSLLTGVADSVVADRALSGEAVSVGFVIPFWTLLGGLLLLALSEAFAQGVRLQDDSEGLV